MFGRFCALLLIIILSPLIGLITTLIWIIDGKPIFYSHQRYGLQMQKIKIHKFRTMIVGSGPPVTLHEDLRVTELGKFLRFSKLDELPQLINILSGDLSFVGPRPESVQIVENNLDSFSYLETTKPGITDINSIIFKDETHMFRISDLEEYEVKILPIKSELTNKTGINFSLKKKCVIIFLTLFSFVHFDLTLKVINRYFFTSVDTDIRNKLNKLFLRHIF